MTPPPLSRWLLIDLDAAASWEKREPVGNKVSSGYAPPEALFKCSLADKAKLDVYRE